MSILRRLHGGRPGLWWAGIITTLGTIALGIAFVFDGTGVTSSPTFSGARHMLTGLGIPDRNVMNVWGIVFIAVGLYGLWPLVRPATTLVRGSALLPVSILWALWSALFLSYAVGHHGFGLVGAITWFMIAGVAMATTLALFSHSRDT